jgi:hypothetical protein
MKWEYQTVKLNVTGTWGVNFDVDKTQDFTNQLGAEGWELVSAFPSTRDTDIQEKSSLFSNNL